MIRDSQRSLYEAAEAEKAAESASQSQRVKPKGNRLTYNKKGVEKRDER